MKAYTIWAYIEEHDEETDELYDVMGLLESIRPFATLQEAQRYLISLPLIDLDGSPSVEDLANEGLVAMSAGTPVALTPEAEVDGDGLMRETTRLHGFEGSDEKR